MIPPACVRHRDLVDLACSETPTDEILERYADEIPACADCQRALARALQVHPAVLSADPGPPPASLDGLDRLHRALFVPPPRRSPIWTAGVLALALAAGITWFVWPPPPGSAQAPDGAPEVVRAPPRPAPPPLAPRPPIEAAENVDVEATPVVVAPAPRAVPATDPQELGLLAMADPTPVEGPDWPAPPFVELRDGIPKGDAAMRAAQLVLSGGQSPHPVGDRVQLTVVTSSAIALAVCVTGPEVGMVWRGGVPAGRTELSRDGHLQSFAFGAPGTYRFALSTRDLEGCADPGHVVEVEVLP